MGTGVGCPARPVIFVGAGCLVRDGTFDGVGDCLVAGPFAATGDPLTDGVCVGVWDGRGVFEGVTVIVGVALGV